jgi:molecular chaperone DnaK (HSP70)
VLRLLSETAATALCWGLPKSLEMPDDTAPPKHALFFDMGHCTTQASLHYPGEGSRVAVCSERET